jgi:rfaE bifunctional protein kinase chain/domain
MGIQRLDDLLARFPDLTILVVGDFFLDKYLSIDRRLAETSLETGLEAHQVTQVRTSPGAAGTVTSNLRAMGVTVVALSVVGDDGEGFELIRGLDSTGVIVDALIIREDRFTPTYTKPMLREADGLEHELNRLDIKNRSPLPEDAEEELLIQLRGLLPQVHGVIIADQVPEQDCGVITEKVRNELMLAARMYPQVAFVADSRERVGLFRDIIVKPNAREALNAIGGNPLAGDGDRGAVEAAGAALYRQTGQPVFLTLGAEGILAYHEGGPTHVPAVRVSGPIDIVGAGDSAIAGITAALCAGATVPEAAEVACLAAGVTIRQVGTTGTASRRQILDCFRDYR